MSGFRNAQAATRRGIRFNPFTHSLVALLAMVAAYFYLFYGYRYLCPPSLTSGPGCSPVAVTFVGANGGEKRIRIEQISCVPGWGDVALFLDDANAKGSRPFLVFRGKGPVIHAAWTSPER